MTNPTTKLLAAASCASGAVMDIIETVRDGTIRQQDAVGGGDALNAMTDALRLLIEVMQDMPWHEEINEDADQLLGAAVRFLDARG